jgi:uncharacterized protein YecT (DUF1311 family)
MLSFRNYSYFLGTIVLLTAVGGCSSSRLSQGILSENFHKQSTLISVSTESGQATMVNTTPAKTCLNSINNQSSNCVQLPAIKSTQHLDEIYQQIVSQLGGASREKLINSQLAWETFVEAQCDFETRGFDSVTLSSPIRDRCLDKMTQQRTQDLKRYLTSN